MLRGESAMVSTAIFRNQQPDAFARCMGRAAGRRVKVGVTRLGGRIVGAVAGYVAEGNVTTLLAPQAIVAAPRVRR